ncbi:MAG: diguanylate cyclase [Alphaproteobacteria bacterium]|nr:diguanylate cyclase [Alphaproteobacteria bacterium]
MPDPIICRRNSGPRFTTKSMAAFELSREMVALCRDGVIEDINSAGAQMLGGTKPDILGRDFCQFLGKDYFEVGQHLLSMEGIEVVPIPVELCPTAGHRRQVELVVHPAREVGLGCTIVTAKDISKQARLARSAKRREDRFRILVERSMHLICQCRNEHIEYINPAGADMLGADHDCTPVGWPVWELFAGEYRDIAKEALLDILAEPSLLPMRMQRCDGTVIDVQLMASKIPSASGDLEYMIEARDISAHIRAVSALRTLNKTLETRVSERTKDLTNANAFLETLLEAIPTPVWWKDVEECFLGYNRAFRKFFGLAQDTWLGERMDAVLPLKMPAEQSQPALPFQQVRPPIEYETELRLNDGQRNVIVSEKSWAGHSNEFSGTIGVLLDITHRKTMEEELRLLATTDSLTGINNRRHFMEIATAETERARRYGHTLSAMMLDIDHFKKVNDTYGHAAGDDVLRAMTKICSSILRKGDALGRLGGEEFAILLPETEIKGALTLAERLRENIAQAQVQSGIDTIRFTTSIGVSQLYPGEQSVEALLSRADDALYEAKNSGRNKVMPESK